MSTANEMPEIGPRDIVFDCPICQKSMVVDEIAEGLTVDCPGCGGQVIVPPRPGQSVPESTVSPFEGAEAQLSALIGKLRELQAQRGEISNNIVARLNDINRQMVMLARLEVLHQKMMQEGNRLFADGERSQTK